MLSRKQSADQREKNSLGLAFFCRNQRKKKKLEKLQTKSSKDHVIERKKREKSCLEVCFYNQTKKLRKTDFSSFFLPHTHKTFPLQKKKKRNVRFYTILGLFFPKTLFFRTLGRYFAQMFFFFTRFFFPFFLHFFVKHPFTLQKVCFTILRNSK